MLTQTTGEVDCRYIKSKKKNPDFIFPSRIRAGDCPNPETSKSEVEFSSKRSTSLPNRKQIEARFRKNMSKRALQHHQLIHKGPRDEDHSAVVSKGGGELIHIGPSTWIRSQRSGLQRWRRDGFTVQD